MNRRQLVQSAAGLAVLARTSRVRAGATAGSLSPRTLTLLRESSIVDLCGANSPVHAISMQPVHYDNWIAKYRKAGVTWLSMTVGSDFTKTTGRMLHVLAANRRYILERPEEYVFVHKVADVARARAEGRLGVNFNFQGSNPLEGDINLVEILRTLGVGHMLLAYNDKNLAAGGSHDRDNPGLSNFGRALVAEMNRVGMVCDGSHMSARSTLEMCEASAAPVIFSHSCARALRDHERNIGDDQIRAAAATGGVIGVNGVSLFLSEALYDPSAQQMFRHIDYIAELVGDRHVGLGPRPCARDGCAPAGGQRGPPVHPTLRRGTVPAGQSPGHRRPIGHRAAHRGDGASRLYRRADTRHPGRKFPARVPRRLGLKPHTRARCRNEGTVPHCSEPKKIH